MSLPCVSRDGALLTENAGQQLFPTFLVQDLQSDVYGCKAGYCITTQPCCHSVAVAAHGNAAKKCPAAQKEVFE